MRAIWSGEITFGLVNVPVKLYDATRSPDVSFQQVHDEDHGRIRYQRTCEVCGREIDDEHIDKACVLRIHQDLLALQTLRWPQDLKEAGEDDSGEGGEGA